MGLFTNTVLATINHITLPVQVLGDEVRDFEGVCASWFTLPVQVHVFDFKSVRKLHRSFYVSATKFKKEAEGMNMKVISINLSPELLVQLKNDGMERALGHLKNLNLLEKPQPKDSRDEVRSWLSKYAVEAARLAMSTMFGTTVAADENYLEAPKEVATKKFFKVAIIQGDGTKVKVVFRLFFERSTLEALTKTIAVATGTPADEELLLSTATELLNIIYTSVKSKLNDDRGYDLPPALPSLQDAAPVNIELKSAKEANWIPLVTPLGAYYLQIELGS